MSRELRYTDLLESNSFLRNLSDTTYWLCITRTVQESKLFPMNPYMLLSYLNSFYASRLSYARSNQ